MILNTWDLKMLNVENEVKPLEVTGLFEKKKTQQSRQQKPQLCWKYDQKQLLFVIFLLKSFLRSTFDRQNRKNRVLYIKRDFICSLFTSCLQFWGFPGDFYTFFNLHSNPSSNPICLAPFSTAELLTFKTTLHHSLLLSVHALLIHQTSSAGTSVPLSHDLLHQIPVSFNQLVS